MFLLDIRVVFSLVSSNWTFYHTHTFEPGMCVCPAFQLSASTELESSRTITSCQNETVDDRLRGAAAPRCAAPCSCGSRHNHTWFYFRFTCCFGFDEARFESRTSASCKGIPQSVLLIDNFVSSEQIHQGHTVIRNLARHTLDHLFPVESMDSPLTHTVLDGNDILWCLSSVMHQSTWL